MCYHSCLRNSCILKSRVHHFINLFVRWYIGKVLVLPVRTYYYMKSLFTAQHKLTCSCIHWDRLQTTCEIHQWWWRFSSCKHSGSEFCFQQSKNYKSYLNQENLRLFIFVLLFNVFFAQLHLLCSNRLNHTLYNRGKPWGNVWEFIPSRFYITCGPKIFSKGDIFNCTRNHRLTFRL